MLLVIVFGGAFAGGAAFDGNGTANGIRPNRVAVTGSSNNRRFMGILYQG
jgi:hypothetical protein